MSNQVYYLKGNTYVDGDGKPALIKKGNQLIVTDDFKGGGGESYVPPAYSTEEHLTGRKWIDSITTSYTTIETDTDVDVPLNAYAVDPTYKACMPLKTGMENATLKVLAFDASFTAETVTIEFVKATTPAETTNNTRTVKKSTSKKG